MNYRNLILLELDKFANTNRGMSMGEIFYSFLRSAFLNGKLVMDASDEEIFNSLQRAMKVEVAEEELTEQEKQEFIDGRS